MCDLVHKVETVFVFLICYDFLMMLLLSTPHEKSLHRALGHTMQHQCKNKISGKNKNDSRNILCPLCLVS